MEPPPLYPAGMRGFVVGSHCKEWSRIHVASASVRMAGVSLGEEEEGGGRGDSGDAHLRRATGNRLP